MASAPRTIDQFQLGEVIGKGGYGTVFKGLNTRNGNFVAIKQIPLKNLKKDQIASIQSETNLLRKLNHTHIVKYIDSKQTKDHLYIIIEYVENGSLSSVVKKFGKIPEALVALYTEQVLQGLVYLHQEGVIHRDIKGANILTTKDSVVKLADFGVAALTSDADNESVVGTPYWMAPEVIELNPPTPSSDIWSLGCTVIELLTGSPPYFDLQPMPALFRIVQDEHPPLPADISPAARDFLIKCFNKDAIQRPSAKKLLSHPWIRGAPTAKNSKSDVDVYKEMAEIDREAEEGRNSTDADENWDAISPTVTPSVAAAAASTNNSTSNRPSKSRNAGEKKKHHHHHHHKPSKVGSASTEQDEDDVESPDSVLGKPVAAPTSAKPKGKAAMLKQFAEEEEEDDYIDSDINIDIDDKLPALPAKGKPKQDHTRLPSLLPSSTAAAAAASNQTQKTNGHAEKKKPILQVEEEEEENWDDLGSALESKLGAKSPPPAQSAPKFSSPSSNMGSMLLSGVSPTSSSIPSSSPLLQNAASKKPVSKESFIEADGEDKYDDLLATKNMDALRDLDFAAKLKQKMSRTWEDERSSRSHHGAAGSNILDRTGSNPTKPSSAQKPTPTGRVQPQSQTIVPSSQAEDEERDVFGDEFIEDENFFINDSHGMILQKTNEAISLISKLTPEQDDNEIQNTCNKLLSILTEHPDVKTQLVAHHGTIPIMEMLDVSNPAVLSLVLRVINKIIESNKPFQETLCLLGILPSVMKFSELRYGHQIRQEAAIFIQTIISPQSAPVPSNSSRSGAANGPSASSISTWSSFVSSTGGSPASNSFTLQMFIACRGLPVMVDFLAHEDEQFDEYSPIIFMAIDGILTIFNMRESSKIRTPKNDFCHLFAKHNLLSNLSKVLVNLPRSKNSHAAEYMCKTVEIFTICSNADSFVRNHLSQYDVMKKIVTITPTLSSDLKSALLNCIKNVSQDPTTLDSLQKAGVIPMLVKNILEQNDGEHVQEMHAKAIHALYNLSKIKRSRQDSAAAAGIIPQLQRIIQKNSPLKHFALPMLCDLAHASKRTREELWKHNGVVFFLDLLKQGYWTASALDALSVWLADETKRVQSVMKKTENIQRLTEVFKCPNYNSFVALLPPMEKIVKASKKVNVALGNSEFVTVLVQHLRQNYPDALTRRSLLRILESIYELHQNPKKLIAKYDLLTLLKTLMDNDPSNLINMQAAEILQVCEQNMKL